MAPLEAGMKFAKERSRCRNHRSRPRKCAIDMTQSTQTRECSANARPTTRHTDSRAGAEQAAPRPRRVNQHGPLTSLGLKFLFTPWPNHPKTPKQVKREAALSFGVPTTLESFSEHEHQSLPTFRVGDVGSKRIAWTKWVTHGLVCCEKRSG